MESTVQRIITKITSARWILAVVFSLGMVYCMCTGVNVPDYGVMLCTLIVKSYFDRTDRK